MRSIGGRLFAILFATTGIIWLSAAAWIYVGTRAKVEHILDARLVQAARMVNSLITDRAVDAPRAARLGAPPGVRPTYERQLSCQIWSLNGILVGRSDSAPEAPLSQQNNGFSVTMVSGTTWRSYAIENKAAGMRVLVGDNVTMRSRLVGNMMKGLLVPGLAIIPLLAGLTWLSVRRGLQPLRRAADVLGERKANDLRPLPIEGEPLELRPVVGALNRLLSRIAEARQREKNFIAFAAHEMRTPLAGLKTHAQLALSVEDMAIREASLSQIVVGVDRTSRLVRQLLDMSQADGHDIAGATDVADVGRIMTAVVNDLESAHRSGVSVRVDPRLDDLRLPGNPDLIAMAIRNVLENAVLHSPADGTVHCHLMRSARTLAITIDDEGRGIPPDDLTRVTERFYRGRNKTVVGSGLGLSIVEAALAACNGTLTLRNREDGGLRVQIMFTDIGPDVDSTSSDPRPHATHRDAGQSPAAAESADMLG